MCGGSYYYSFNWFEAMQVADFWLLTAQLSFADCW
jgi:hypothetical protein